MYYLIFRAESRIRTYVSLTEQDYKSRAVDRCAISALVLFS